MEPTARYASVHGLSGNRVGPFTVVSGVKLQRYLVVNTSRCMYVRLAGNVKERFEWV